MADVNYESWIIDLRWDELPPEVQEQATLCLTDILATAAGALLLPTAGTQDMHPHASS